MAIFLVGLLVVGAASAADVDVNDTGKLSAGENDEIVSVENDVDVLGEGEYNYTQLKDQFRFDGDITLFAGNYTYVSGDGDTIEITTSRVIDGNGAVIDMANSGHGAFSVTTSGVTIKNLTIKNANFEGNGGAIYFMYSGIVINCNFTNNTATVYGGAVYFQDEGNVTNCNFTDNNARIYGGAVYFQKGGNVTNCNFTDNTASGTGGAVYFQNEGNVTNCNFTGNNATWYGGAVYFQKAGNVTNCNFTGNNATTGSAIYFWSASATKTVSNSRFLNNIANAETLEVTKNDNNITITFTGNDNLLNAIYSNSDVTFTNVTYWGSKGIVNTGSSAIKPSRSNKEAGQNITLEIYDSDSLVDNVTLVTDDNGQVSYDLSKLSNGKYRYKAYHPEDSYYTYAESNDTFTKGVGDFNLLQRYINAADSVLTLDRNYTFTTGLDENLTDGIIIDKPLTINGNGFTINADGKARIFQIKSNDVVLKDITFKNGYTNGDGGAIHWSTNNSNILNCYFINNTAKRGGANHFENELQDSNINATFINNTANGLYLFYGGGANYFKDALNNITISGDYSNNKAVNYGGANYFNSKISTLTIAGDYAGNAANGDGGANYFNSLFNVTITGDYTSNTARNDGGANCFLSALTDVNITGDYTNNKAGLGGANNFEKELTNVAISGKYVKNTATGFAAGANIFKDQLTNVTITGDYISNTAMSFNAFGGANSFVKELANVTITGNYTNNSADYLGGANCFLSELTDVNITGDYTGNRVNSSGGANYFEKVLTNVTITGDYTSNIANYHTGGANYFLSELTNVAITGDYSNNKAKDHGGANYFDKTLFNLTITGDYTSNTAGVDGGANYFKIELTEVNITGDYSNNTAGSDGGANHFNTLTNVTITGNYISNTAGNTAGANHFNTLTNVTITGNYISNTAGSDGGANHFGMLTNVTITGDYISNTAGSDGGANHFGMLTNVTITGDYISNGAGLSGGANYFFSELTNVVISGDYTNNTSINYFGRTSRDNNGGANFFRNNLTNVTITGDYIGNAADNSGGANYFSEEVTNVIIMGDYISNSATNGSGGANYFKANYYKDQLTNVVISGDYASNTAKDAGGANYIHSELTNVNITGDYCNNTAGSAGANYFENALNNVAIIGDYAINTANGTGGANYFHSELTNVSITGDYTNNKANEYGGANCFYSYLINVTITGDYTSNTASNYNGGANYFHEELTNVAITGDYTSNTANANGGANCFNSYLINVNITGTFTNNKATNDDGGANSFLSPLTNVTITGDYTANKANGYGGANSFLNPLTNVTISGDYTGNTACDGGANYFSKITNVNITGEYTANKALGSGGAIYFAIETNYLNVRGVFINNSGFYIIFIDKSIENNVIRDSIFLNNNAKNINLDQGDIQLVNNWFGNNATNYNVTPDIGSVTPDNWLFLNATVDPVKFTSSTNVTFKLDSYDANTKNVTDYNNNLISPIELTLTSTNATVKNSTHLNETVKYVAGDGEKGSVTATFENAQYTIELQTDKKNPKLSVESETFNYNETMALALSYNPNATGNVSVTLNGKKHIYNYTGLALNVTVMLSGDILPDEYNVTVMYGGDVNFFGTSANSTLTVKKANSTLKVTDITFDYNGTGSCEVTYTNATGVTAEVIGHNEATINVTNNLITVSGLDAGNYSLSVTTITSEGYSNVTKTSKITVKPTLSLVSAENVNVTYGEDIIIPVKSVNATEVKYEIIECDKVVNNGTVMSGENITGLRLASGTYTVNLTTIVDSNHIQSSGQSLLTVKKAQSSIDVNGTESYYKNDAVLNYAVVNATGVNVDIVDWAGNPMKSGVDYNISISKSQIIIDFFNDGRYVANVTTITDNNHTSACMGAEIRVLPVIDLEISIAPENQTAHYGDTLSWKVIIVNHGPSMAENLYLDFFADDGIIFTDQYGKQYAKHYRFSDVYPIGVDYPFICILKTLANATDAELCFNVTVGDIYSIYPNLSKYNASASVKVEHASANISVNADSQIVVGESLTVTVELPSDATGNVTVTVDGEKYIGTINEGIATISIPDLAAGEKTAIISYPGDNRYSPINETRDITVSRKNTTADISAPTSITLGDDASVDVKLPGDAKGNVTVIVDGEILDTVPLSNGAVDVTLPEMKAGNHTVEVIYSGDEKYNPVSETKNITVLKQNATAEVSLPENVTYGDDESVDVILPGDATGNVTVKVDGDDVGSVEVVNGSASVALPTLSAGDHAVEVVYSGDDKYAPVSQTVNVAVVKSTPKLTSNKKTFKNTDKYKKYTVSLKDSKGNAIVNATVTLKVNGKTYTAKTNSNGKATFKLTKLTKKGTYTAVIKFAGDEKYNNASAKAKINVKSTWKTISKGSSYHTMVKKIQRALKNHGFYIKYNKRHLIVDGIFHIYTEMAVKQFQKANGLKQTGRVDEITAKELGLI